MYPTLFEEVAMQIAGDILEQNLSEETDFGDEVALMKRYHTTRATIQRAIFILVRDKLLFSEDGEYHINPDPYAWRGVAEKRIAERAKELFYEARKFGLEDHRTVDIILRNVGLPPVQG